MVKSWKGVYDRLRALDYGTIEDVIASQCFRVPEVPAIPNTTYFRVIGVSRAAALGYVPGALISPVN